MKSGRLIVVEDEEYASLAPSSSSSARLVKVDGETGHVELMPARAPPPPRQVPSQPTPLYEAGPGAVPPLSSFGQGLSHEQISSASSLPIAGGGPPAMLLMPALLFLALLLILFFPRLQRQERIEIKPSTSANITITSFRRRVFKLLSSPLLISKDGLAWCLGLLTGSIRKSEGEIRAQAGHARELLDKALEKDDPFEARRALERLVILIEGGVPAWLGEAVGPLKEEWREVEEREEHHQQIVGELDEAITRCENTLERITEDEDVTEEWSSRSSPSYLSQSSSSSSALAIHRRTVSVYSSPPSSPASSSSSALLWVDSDDQELRLVAALERATETLATAAAGIAAATAADENLKTAPARGLGGVGGVGGVVSTLLSSVQRGKRILKLWQRGEDGAAEVELAHHHGHAMNPPPPFLMPVTPASRAAGGGWGGGGRIAHSSSSSSSNIHSRKSSFVVVDEVGDRGMEEGVEENNVLFPPVMDETNASAGETGTGLQGGVVEKVEDWEEEGKEGGEGSETESTGRRPEGEGRGSQEERASTNSSCSGNSAMIVSNGREGRMLVHDHHHHHQQQVLMVGAFTQSVQQELRRQTTAARVIQLEGMLESRRQYRARQKREEGRAAKLEQIGRKGALRQRGREVVEARRRHEVECGKADEKRRLKDQALFTYLLPVSLAVFCVVVYLASLSEGSRGGESGGMLIIDVLWHVPFHDLLYGDCKARPASLPSTSSSTASKIKVVHHNVKGIPGAAHSPSSSSSHFVSSGLQLLNFMVTYVVPEGVDLGLNGAFEMTGCYVKRTLALVVNTGVMVLLHHLMGELGLGQHRAKLHVGLSLYCCRKAFARLTWRSLLSVRCVLGFHGLLWVMTAWRDEGHAFKHRHILFHRVVPMLAVGVGVWDATRLVDPKEALESFHLLAKQIVN